MEVKASLNYCRMAPRKIRLVVDSIRGKNVEEARVNLTFFPKRSAQPILKLLNSAIANAKNNFGVKEENISSFYIKKITVDEGPKLKRWRPVARGSAHEIQKKTSHVNLILDEKKKTEKKEKSKTEEKTKKTEQKKRKINLTRRKPKKS